MLTDLIDEAIWASDYGTDKQLKKAFDNLAKVGVDKRTAFIMIRARVKELEEEKGAKKND